LNKIVPLVNRITSHQIRSDQINSSVYLRTAHLHCLLPRI
jgi:hypothetical protein